MDRSSFWAGVRDVLPVLPGFIPLGVVTGLAAKDLGMTAIEAIVMSAIIFAGLAQLTAFKLLANDAHMLVVVVSALMVNLRFMMYSASVEPYLKLLSRPQKWIAGFLISTPAVVLSFAKFTSKPSDKYSYYFGVAIPVYLNFVSSTAAGAILGTRVPPGLKLDFIVPLVFLALLFQLLDTRSSIIAAICAGLVAVPAASLPFNVGLIVATILGTVAGLTGDVGGSV